MPFQLDEEELVEARWWTREEVRRACKVQGATMRKEVAEKGETVREAKRGLKGDLVAQRRYFCTQRRCHQLRRDFQPYKHLLPRKALKDDPSLTLLVPPKRVVARELIEAWLAESEVS